MKFQHGWYVSWSPICETFNPLFHCREVTRVDEKLNVLEVLELFVTFRQNELLELLVELLELLVKLLELLELTRTFRKFLELLVFTLGELIFPKFWNFWNIFRWNFFFITLGDHSIICPPPREVVASHFPRIFFLVLFCILVLREARDVISRQWKGSLNTMNNILYFRCCLRAPFHLRFFFWRSELKKCAERRFLGFVFFFFLTFNKI